MAELFHENDSTGAIERTKGSDGRQNTSARTDSRAYYNSRDRGQMYSFTWTFADTLATQTAAYLRNDATDGKHLVIHSIGVNSEKAVRFKLSFVTGTAANGTAVTPTNLNKTSSNAASATAQSAVGAANGITSLTPDGEIDFAYCQIDGHEEFRIGDTIRLGQNDAIEIEVFEQEAAGDVSGVIFFYFE